MKPSVLIFSYHFYPAQSIGAKRPTALARALVDKGHDVVVIAARPKGHSARKQDGALGEGIRVIYVSDPPSVEDSLFNALSKVRSWFSKPGADAQGEVAGPAGNPDTEPENMSLSKILLRHFHSFKLTFGVAKAWASFGFFRVLALRFSRNFDLVISSGPPMVAHISASMLRKLSSAKHIIDLRDPWGAAPDDNTVYRSRFRLKLEALVTRRCYAAGDMIVCASPGIKRTVTDVWPSLAGKTRIVLNGYDPVDQKTDEQAPAGVLRLLFAGSIYLNRDPFPLFNALVALLKDPSADRSKIRLDMYGDCATFNGVDIAAWLAQKGLDDCVFLHQPVSQTEIQKQVATSTILLNFAQGQKSQIPAKTYEYMTTGKQSLVITEADSDTAAIVNESGTGIIVPPDDAALMLETLRKLYTFYVTDRKHYHVAAADLSRYSREFQNGIYLEAIEELLC